MEGFTLIETLMAVVIFTVLTAAISLLFVTLYRNQKEEIAMIERQSIANRALETMSNEIRRINRAENGSYALIVTEPQKLAFYADVDGDHETEKVIYALEGTDLTRTVTESRVSLTAPYDYSASPVKKVMAPGIYNGAEPVFTYYGENYDGSEAALSGVFRLIDVKVVGVTLLINTPERVVVKSPLKLEVKAQMRNLK